MIVAAPPKPAIEIEVAPEEDVETQIDPPCRVLLHNDDVTPYDFVIVVLRTVFKFSFIKAVAVTQRAHVTGMAYVGSYPCEEAKYLVGQAHGMARVEGYPLTLTVELET